ncbi:MAG: hypothetical protein WCH11_00215 [Bdellovibrio sp.]
MKSCIIKHVKHFNRIFDPASKPIVRKTELDQGFVPRSCPKILVVLQIFIGSLLYGAGAQATPCRNFQIEMRGSVSSVVPASNRAVVLVSPISSGESAAPTFARQGLQVLTVVDAFNLSPAQRERVRNLWPHFIDLTGIPSLDARAKVIEQYARERGWNLVAVLPGAEHGTKLAMKLSKLLGKSSPKLKTQPYRDHFTDKASYISKLQNSGLSVFESVPVRSLSELEKVLDERRYFRDPRFSVIVAKPAESSGGDGIEIHSSRESLVRHVESILNSANKYKIANQKVLLQQYLGRTEVFINGLVYTHEGRTQVFVTEVAEYDKFKDTNGQPNTYDVTKFLDPREPRVQKMLKFNELALENERFRFGFFHREIFPQEISGELSVNSIFSTDGAFRLVGARYTDIAEFSQGDSQVSIMAKILADPKARLRGKKENRIPQVYSLLRPNYSWIGYNFKKHPDSALNPRLLQELESFRLRLEAEGGKLFYHLDRQPGELLPLGKDLATKFGVFAVTHPDDATAARWIYRMKFEVPWFSTAASGESTGTISPPGFENRRGKWEPADLRPNSVPDHEP